MKALIYASVVLFFCALLTGCATPGASPLTYAALTPVNSISAARAADAVTIGKSSKADVTAALGKTTVVSFDSGFEVWLYQIKSDMPVRSGWWDRAGSENRMRGKTEFVVLFDPSGVVTKTRIRPAPAPTGAKGR